MKTWIPTPAEINRGWVVVDASDLVLGRLASHIALRLRGKHKPEYTPFLDNGDFVVVVNAAKVKVTGNKLQDKKYRKHTGYFGGLKETTMKDLLAKKPEKVLELAVRGMLPKNRLSRHLLTKLKVYPGPEHPHAAQNPVTIDIK